MRTPLRLPTRLGAALLGSLLAAAAVAAAPTPLPRAHAHNDYLHARPLLDALEHGFCSVEADIHLVDGELLVAHDRDQVRPERTLRALYLEPLRRRVRENGGRVYRGGPGFTLLIDLKGEAEPTYAVLRPLLRDYAEMLTRFRPDETREGAVTVILSGNRPRAALEAEPERWAALDGRLPDLGTGVSRHLVPLVSDNWRAHFTWHGEGPPPAAERARLRERVERAHREGRRIRFWATPDLPAAWKELDEAGVDLVNTDDLPGLSAFRRR
ncbi:MAG: phosphatidylinositol-specific phospholipase C/glycerophosphodiester phosphodiesterase family protein [Armatimonadota bacterium]